MAVQEDSRLQKVELGEVLEDWIPFFAAIKVQDQNYLDEEAGAFFARPDVATAAVTAAQPAAPTW